VSKSKAQFRLLELADLIFISLALVAAMIEWGDLEGEYTWYGVLDSKISVLNALFVAAYLYFWRICLKTGNLYERRRSASVGRELADLALASLIAVGVLVPAGIAFRHDFVTAPFLAGFYAITYSGLATLRWIARVRDRRRALDGSDLHRVVIISDRDTALGQVSDCMRREGLDYLLVRAFDLRDRPTGTEEDWVLERLSGLLEVEVVDEVFVSLSLRDTDRFAAAITRLCETQGIVVHVLPNLGESTWTFSQVQDLGGAPVFSVFPAHPYMLRDAGKRTIDVVIAGLGLLVLAPLFAVVAVAIKATSPGPVFYVQRRVGRNRREFSMFKFRTMIKDADGMMAQLEDKNEAVGHCFKIADDPRITRVGKWLRHSSVDELPQLLNVLKGDMSLVGPRPLSLRDAYKIDIPAYKRRFSVKPGITCLWQIRSRQPLFDDWMQADMEYIDHWSPSLDIKILLKTIPAVLSGAGAE